MSNLITYMLKVADVRQETTDAVTICFKQPGLKKVIYQPGQYLTLIFRINGRRYIRPYSFSSAPGVDATLNVTVKRVLSGIVSNHIIDNLKVDDLVEVMPPMGHFVVELTKLDDSTPIVLWGAGSGITPLISIAKFLLKNRKNEVTLVYGNRDFENTLFVDQIKLLNQEHSNFTVWHFLSKASISNAHPHHVEGRISPSKVLSVLKENDKSSDSLHYICGPLGLKESVKGALNKYGISEANIFSEDFEVVKDSKDFENVITRSVEIIKDQLPQIVEVVKGRSILEAGLDAGIELSYSCQTGSCSICKATLQTGDVKMVSTANLSEELLENEYLLCCTYPLSDNISFKV